MANFNTVNLKGKDYVMVNDRVKFFRQNYPNWSLVTELKKASEGIYIVQAFVLDENGRKISSGLAEEKEGATFINKTSALENCETSAVGRCLGFMAIGIDTSIASAEEVANAIKQQSRPKMQTPEEFQATINGETR